MLVRTRTKFELKLIINHTIATSEYLNKPLRSEAEVKATIFISRGRARKKRRYVRDAKARADLLRHGGLYVVKSFNPPI